MQSCAFPYISGFQDVKSALLPLKKVRRFVPPATKFVQLYNRAEKCKIRAALNDWFTNVNSCLVRMYSFFLLDRRKKKNYYRNCFTWNINSYTSTTYPICKRETRARYVGRLPVPHLTEFRQCAVVPGYGCTLFPNTCVRGCGGAGKRPARCH